MPAADWMNLSNSLVIIHWGIHWVRHFPINSIHWDRHFPITHNSLGQTLSGIHWNSPNINWNLLGQTLSKFTDHSLGQTLSNNPGNEGIKQKISTMPGR